MGTLLLSAQALAQNATAPGTPVAPYPTLENISLEWPITGDANGNGTVKVRYRKTGDSAWSDGLALRRVPAGTTQGFSWQNRHAGSVFGLAPGTSYEVELSLTDPDGGNANQTLTVTTRKIPAQAAGAVVKNVSPSSFAAAASAAQPGHVLLLEDGDYAGFVFDNDGSEASPIVIRAANAGKAVIGGDVRLDGRAFVFLEGLTVNGKIKFNDAQGIVVRGCTVNTADDGIVSMGPGSTNGYFCDNVVSGPTAWNEPAVGANGNNLGEGIVLTGPGNVICHNRVKGFRDCISTMEDSAAVNQVSIDIYGNDLEVCADDAVEADFTMGNTRVYRNRATNSFVGMSSQPSLGGPAYFIRNVMFNIIYSPFKLHRGSVGDVAFHNTVVKCGDAFAVYSSDVWSRAFFRNNLFIGGTGGGTYGGYGNGDGDVASLSAAAASCNFDFDGYGSIGTGKFTGNIGAASFASLAELKSKTTEKNAVQVDLGVFAASVTFPSNPFPELVAPDLSLKSGASAVDVGEKLANVNDGFAGSGPDLGAYEFGSPPPEYGPRTGGAGGNAGAGGAAGGAGAGAGGGSAATAGTGAGAGTSGAGGASTGGSGATATGGSPSGSGGGQAKSSSESDGGCGCRTEHRSAERVWLAVIALGVALRVLRRRTRSTR